MDFGQIINQIAVLFLVLFIGLAVRKKNILDDPATRKISSLVVNLTAPMLIISAMMRESNLEHKEILLMVLVSNGLYLFLFFLTLFVPKLLKVEKQNIGIYKFMIMFSNVGFVGFPVAQAILGDTAILYAAIFNLPFYILVYTLGIHFVSMNNEENAKFKWIKIINPGVIAVLIGLIIFSTGFKLPNFLGFLGDTIDMVGGLTTPLSMLVIGSSLANVQIKSVLTNKRIYVYSLLKLIVLPILVLLILSFFGITGMLLGVAVIVAGMPVAANAVILSQEFGGNDVLASEGVFVSTMLSIITIPILAYFISFYI